MILGIGAGDRPLLALGMRPARLASIRASIGAIRELWSGADVTVEDPAFELHDAHLRFGARPDIPDLRLGERPEDARAGRRDRRRRDPARRVVPGGARVGARARRSRRREGGSATTARGGVRIRLDRRRRGGAPWPRPARSRRGSRRRLRRSASSAACRRPWSNRCANGTRAGSSRRPRKPRNCFRTGSCAGWRSPVMRRTPVSGSRRWPPRAPTRSTCSRSASTGCRRSRPSPGVSHDVSNGAAA